MEQYLRRFMETGREAKERREVDGDGRLLAIARLGP